MKQTPLSNRLHKIDDFLYGFLNIPREEFMGDSKQCDVYLKRLRALSKLVGSPEKKFKYIHIAGTSGKGSVAAMLESILCAANKKVASYTSPHFTTSAERIKVNGEIVQIKDIQRATAKIKLAVQKMMRTSKLSIPSYFEIDFLVALLVFAARKVDWVVLETGCGGRFDSTNIIPSPKIAIITNIGLDHTAILGNTKIKIAYEKVGIVKKNSEVLLGEPQKNIREALAKWSLKQGARDVTFIPKPKGVQTSTKGTAFTENEIPYKVPIPGEHQAHNARLALSAALLLNIPEKVIREGLRASFKPGVFEIVKRYPMIIVDGAHNVDKIKSTAKLLDQVKLELTGARVHLILGMSANKAIRSSLKTLLPHVSKLYATRFTKNYFRKCFDPRKIAREARKIKKISTETFLFPHDALDSALHNARKKDIILITGSIFLAGELRERWYSEEKILSKRKMKW